MKKIKNICILLVICLLLMACSQNSKEEKQDSTSFEYGPDEYIIGIEPGSGLYQATTQVIKDYGLEQTMTANASSVMTQLLGDAIADQEAIVVTGWSPHWKFEEYDLKYLEDPLKSYGEPEKIYTFARQGFKESNPGAYEIIDNFYWEIDDMQSVLKDINDGMNVDEAARQWVNSNPHLVDQWTRGTTKGEGQTVKIVHPSWDSEYATSYVLKTVLEDMGYRPIMMTVEIGPMFAGLAYGSADVSVSVWLPLTHKDYYKKYGKLMDNLGPNLKNARIGLVVPTYMDLDSIEDLVDYEL